MENLLLDIKNNSKIQITILYENHVSDLIKQNFPCFDFNEIDSDIIKNNYCLIYFKEYKKTFNLSHIKFKNIKKICAIFEQVNLSDYFDSFNFHIASGIITNYKTNIKKLNLISDLPKFHIHNGFDFSKLKLEPLNEKKIGMIGSHDDLKLKKLQRIFSKASFDTILLDEKNIFNNDCGYIFIHDQSDMIRNLNFNVYCNKKVIAKKNQFTKEFEHYCDFLYDDGKNLFEYLTNKKNNILKSTSIQEFANIKTFVKKFKETIFLILGFYKSKNKVSYYDSGSFVSEKWSLIDKSLEKTIDGYGLRFFSNANREIKHRPETLKNWSGIVHGKLDDNFYVLKNCRGVFVFSKETEKSLKEKQPDLTTHVLRYPIIRQQEKFSFEMFSESKSIYSLERITYIPDEYKNEIISPCTEINFTNGIVYLEFKNYQPFELLTQCIECNTPVLIKKCEIAEEYLGKEYPLFIDDKFILDLNKIKEANVYLKNLNKNKFRIKNFLKSITSSECYKKLPKESPKPLLRITLGRTSKDGYEITYYNIRSIIKCYGTEKFDICICHNNISKERLALLERKWENIKSPIKFYKQKNCELPLNLKFERDIDATVHHHISAGSFWKICPPRMRPNAHEIIIDNDIVFLRPLPEIEKFLSSSVPMTLEDSSVHMGFYEFMRDYDENITLNSGIIGLPPNYNFEKKLCSVWDIKRPSRPTNGGDEQGLITTILSKSDHILIPRSHVIGLHPEKLHVNAFSSGIPSYQILKVKTERDFISYFRVDIHKLVKKTYALHFYQINRSSIKHRAWDRFLNYYRYLQSPNSLK